VTTNGVNLMLQLMTSIKRCCDRGCRLASRHTK
jgi:hypothetical protein